MIKMQTQHTPADDITQHLHGAHNSLLASPSDSLPNLEQNQKTSTGGAEESANRKYNKNYMSSHPFLMELL